MNLSACACLGPLSKLMETAGRSVQLSLKYLFVLGFPYIYIYIYIYIYQRRQNDFSFDIY